MIHVLILAAVYGAFVLEGSGLLRHVPPAGIWPLYLCLMLPIRFCRPAAAVVWAGGIGLLADGLGAGRLGVELLLAATLALAAVRMRERGLPRSRSGWFCVACLVIGGMCAGSGAIRMLLDDGQHEWRMTALNFLWRAVPTILLATVLFGGGQRSRERRMI